MNDGNAVAVYGSVTSKILDKLNLMGADSFTMDEAILNREVEEVCCTQS
jgi:hypothetical protein